MHSLQMCQKCDDISLVKSLSSIFLHRCIDIKSGDFDNFINLNILSNSSPGSVVVCLV